MKYYCLGNAIPIIKLSYSGNFIDDYTTPVFGKLPVTQEKMQHAFDQSTTLILCKTLEAANALRQTKIVPAYTNMTSDFIKHAVAEGYPLNDYAIYEIEVDDAIKIDFNPLRDTDVTQLEQFTSFDLYFKVKNLNDRSELPDIAISAKTKSDINPTLINCHYLSPLMGPVETNEVKSCAIL